MKNLGKRLLVTAFMIVAAPILFSAMVAFMALLVPVMPVWAFVAYEKVWGDLTGKVKR